MKLIMLFLSLHFLTPTRSILVIDRELKNPASYSDDFTVNHYLKKNFPIYSADLNMVIQTTEQILKKAERPINYYTSDTTQVNQTTFIVDKDPGDKTINVRLTTRLAGKNMSFDFELIRKETNKRKVQRRLLDFISYLEADQK